MIVKKHLLIALLAGFSLMACKNDKKAEEAQPEEEVKLEEQVKPTYSLEMSKSSVMARLMTIPEINTMGRLSISASLSDMLMAEGPFTVFAPSNDAFIGMDQEAYQSLLDPSKKDSLVTLLKNHMIPTELGSAELLQQLKGGPVDFTAMGGAKLVVKMEDNDILITDETGTSSVVSKTDITAMNGVLHVINTVLTTGPNPEED